MTLGSLFDGIGGWLQALGKAWPGHAWICLIVSLMGNCVFGYMFWRAIRQNGIIEKDDWHYEYGMYGRSKVRDIK